MGEESLVKQIEVYGYTPETKEYTGIKQARLCPVTKKEYIYPAFTTTIKPSSTSSGEVAVFDEENQEWSVINDHRGQNAYSTETGEFLGIVNYIGDIEDGVTLLVPDENQEWDGEQWVDKDNTLTEEEKWEAIRMQRNSLLSSTDWTQIPDAALTDEQVAYYQSYRQALRDIPETYENPDDVVWPEV